MQLKAFKTQPQDNLNTECITCTKPSEDARNILFTEHWKALLHPTQNLLGSCLVAPIRHVHRLCDLTPEENQEFHELIQIFEPALENAFGADLINFMCLRNWAFREDDPDPPFKDGKPNPHVHWHVFTRYKEPVEFEGLTFEDPDFSHPIVFKPNTQSTKLIKDKIIQQIQKQLPIEFI